MFVATVRVSLQTFNHVGFEGVLFDVAHEGIEIGFIGDIPRFKPSLPEVSGAFIFSPIQPIITLNGEENITLQVGETYTEEGATATDNVDGSVNVTTTGSVNTSKAGIYTITYTAKDSSNNSASQTRTVTVEATNHKPIAYSQRKIITNKHIIELYATDSDNDMLTYTVTQDPQNGTLSGIAPHLKYAPNPNFSGSDSFKFKVNDGKVDSNEGTVNISVIKKTNTEKINLLEGKNPNVDGITGFINAQYHKYSEKESHTDDGSGSIELVEHWYTHMVKTATFKLEKGKHYTFGAYMKAIGSDKGQNVMFKISGPGENVEMNWNVSKADQWEEVSMPYRAEKTGNYWISCFTFRYALTTDGRYAKKDGTNLDRSSRVFVDDFYVHETQDIEPNEPYTPKVPYVSSNVKIDEQGNWQIKENEKWKDFFPKFAYQDFYGDFAESARKYSSYGFTGFTNITDIKRMHLAVENGMKYNGIQVNHLTSDASNSLSNNVKKVIKNVKDDISEGTLPATSLIMYEYDNEGMALCNHSQKEFVSNWLKSNDTDLDTGKRARPIEMLNGVSEGVARNNNNYMDVVSSYIPQSGEGTNEHRNPVNTLGMLQKQQNQTAPVSTMQLQCYYHDVFIPSIFKGIGEGAKALNFWRGGTTHNGCPKNFEENVWIPAIKDTFTKIDEMLPIIKEPLGAPWSATVADPSKISIGTRDHDGKHYIILANFGYKDTYVDIHLEGLDVLSARDYFTHHPIANVVNHKLHVPIGHHNKGFLVLELE